MTDLNDESKNGLAQQKMRDFNRVMYISKKRYFRYLSV